MARESKTNPSFCKILINNDFARLLRLPRDFAQKHIEIFPENAKLRISSGETWNVRLEQMDDGDYYFTRGWTKFCDDLELEKFEFMLFWFSEKSFFDVSVYGVTGCEKESFRRPCPIDDYGPKNKHSRSSEIVEKETALTDEETEPENSNPYLEIVFKPHHRSRVAIPKYFAVPAGLIGKKKVALEYQGGHRVNVVLVSWSNEKRRRFELAAGWCEFRKANKLTLGKTYSFEFIPSKKVIQVCEKKG